MGTSDPIEGGQVDQSPAPAPAPVDQQPAATPEELRAMVSADAPPLVVTRPVVTKAVGLMISLSDVEKHLQRPDVPEGVPVSALVIEDVIDVPWPAGVSWVDAVRNAIGR